MNIIRVPNCIDGKYDEKASELAAAVTSLWPSVSLSFLVKESNQWVKQAVNDINLKRAWYSCWWISQSSTPQTSTTHAEQSRNSYKRAQFPSRGVNASEKVHSLHVNILFLLPHPTRRNSSISYFLVRDYRWVNNSQRMIHLTKNLFLEKY